MAHSSPFHISLILDSITIPAILCNEVYKLQKLIEVGTTISILLATIIILMTSIVPTVLLPLRFGWLVTYYIALPVFVTYIPLVLLLVVHLPLPLMIVRLCQKHQGRRKVSYGECDQATVHAEVQWLEHNAPAQSHHLESIT